MNIGSVGEDGGHAIGGSEEERAGEKGANDQEGQWHLMGVIKNMNMNFIYLFLSGWC